MKIVNKYIDYIESEKGYSSNTLRAYRKDLEVFLNTLDVSNPLNITKFDIQDFLQSLKL